MIVKVRKAVFPAAGLGTRFLPATKAQPKEMLPLVDKPLIQYGVEEAMQSGVQNIIIVTGRGKSAIEDHFDVSFELEHLLETRNKKDLLATVRAVSDMIDVSYVRQKEALGLGHAVLRARELVADEPFAVILSDDIIDSEMPCLRQLLDVYEFYSAPVVALMEVPRENISAYGVVDAEPVAHAGGRNRLYRIRNMVEKPKAEDAPSNLAIIGRYVLTPEVFKSLDAVEPGSGGEIQLTDGLKHLLRSRPIYGYRFEGTRYDAGDKLGFLKATVEFALKRYDLGEEFRAYLKTLEAMSIRRDRLSALAARSYAARESSRTCEARLAQNDFAGAAASIQNYRRSSWRYTGGAGGHELDGSRGAVWRQNLDPRRRSGRRTPTCSPRRRWKKHPLGAIRTRRLALALGRVDRSGRRRDGRARSRNSGVAYLQAELKSISPARRFTRAFRR